MKTRRLVQIAVVATAVGATFVAAGLAGRAGATANALPQHSANNVTPISLLSDPPAPGVANADRVRRGRDLVAAGDCMSCHLQDGGQPLAGGLPLKTPFGVIYSSNITSDKRTGIGGWSEDQFFAAMHDGKGVHGENLYPAFPYPWFRQISREDDDAILAYLKTTPSADYTPPANDLHFPFNIRFLVKFWNLLFLRGPGHFENDDKQSAEWNRGAYLVIGPGHCSGCHSPKNWAGADKGDAFLHGGTLDDWVAPDLTNNGRTGLKNWSIEEIAEYLKTGRTIHANAGASMGEVVTYSTSLMSDTDRRAIAVYLKTLPASADSSTPLPASDTMARGAEIYLDACTGCHLEDGAGQPRLFPPLGINAVVQQADATGLVHLLLAGTRTGTTLDRPSPLAMPSFAWKLTDPEIADVATYLRNSWGNSASRVTAEQVHKIRAQIKLDAPRLTANSGDQISPQAPSDGLKTEKATR